MIFVCGETGDISPLPLCLLTGGFPAGFGLCCGPVLSSGNGHIGVLVPASKCPVSWCESHLCPLPLSTPHLNPHLCHHDVSFPDGTQSFTAAGFDASEHQHGARWSAECVHGPKHAYKPEIRSIILIKLDLKSFCHWITGESGELLGQFKSFTETITPNCWRIHLPCRDKQAVQSQSGNTRGKHLYVVEAPQTSGSHSSSQGDWKYRRKHSGNERAGRCSAEECSADVRFWRSRSINRRESDLHGPRKPHY